MQYCKILLCSQAEEEAERQEALRRVEERLAQERPHQQRSPPPEDDAAERRAAALGMNAEEAYLRRGRCGFVGGQGGRDMSSQAFLES